MLLEDNLLHYVNVFHHHKKMHKIPLLNVCNCLVGIRISSSAKTNDL